MTLEQTFTTPSEWTSDPTTEPLGSNPSRPSGSNKPNNQYITSARYIDPEDVGRLSHPKRRTSHSCGQPGGYVHRQDPDAQPDLRGRPTAVELTRAERYWIQRRIEKLGDAADVLERRLLDKVRVTF